MGTRHLIAVVKDNEFKVAQYGQWDGYPDGQGVSVLEFLRAVDLSEFIAKVDTCRWITPTEIDTINADSDWPKNYPHLSRDAGAGVLDLIMESENGLALYDSHAFAGDGLFCEWAWVVDLDNGKFEAYSGFGKSGQVAGRFADMPDLESTDGYDPVSLVQSWDLDNLPDQNTFLATFEEEE